MKRIIKKASELLSEVSSEIQKRDEYYDSRSDKWLDSDAGSEYDENTEHLRDLEAALEDFTSNFD